jgi:hypothetical protein
MCLSDASATHVILLWISSALKVFRLTYACSCRPPLLYRVAAVYFASRQLSGTQNSALGSSSNSLHSPGLAAHAAEAAEIALLKAADYVSKLRWRLLRHAAHEILQFDQYDPDTGESLLPREDLQVVQNVKNLIASLHDELRFEDMRTLLPGLLQTSAYHLLQPAGLRRLQQQLKLASGRDAGAEQAVQYLQIWCREQRRQQRRGGRGFDDDLAPLAGSPELLYEQAMDMELMWQHEPLRVMQVRSRVGLWSATVEITAGVRACAGCVLCGVCDCAGCCVEAQRGIAASGQASERSTRYVALLSQSLTA